MNFYKIPLTNLPNQSFVISLNIDGINKTFIIQLSYKEICGYWLMTVVDYLTKTEIISNIPLLTGGYLQEAGDIFKQYSYLGLGSACVVKTSEIPLDFPNDETLGTEFLLIWGDTYDSIGVQINK